MKHYELSPAMLESWLLEADPSRLEQLWYMANKTRAKVVGDEIHLRGLCELSNYCARSCTYCGLRAQNTSVSRYRLSAEEIFACATLAHKNGYGTLVLQSGEDPLLDHDELRHTVARIVSELEITVTLSLGEMPLSMLESYRAAGAERYLLRFETSNPDLFYRIHPPRAGDQPGQRMVLLRALAELGFEVGSGVMVGIPGQSVSDLVADLLLFKELNLDMVGLGPYLPHPDTPLGHDTTPVLFDKELMTYKMLALARLLLPGANIPSTTALSTLNPVAGRLNGLCRGANVIMPNLTPGFERAQYSIYPNKTLGGGQNPEDSHSRVMACISAANRSPGVGPGFSLNYLDRRNKR